LTTLQHMIAAKPSTADSHARTRQTSHLARQSEPRPSRVPRLPPPLHRVTESPTGSGQRERRPTAHGPGTSSRSSTYFGYKVRSSNPEQNWSPAIARCGLFVSPRGELRLDLSQRPRLHAAGCAKVCPRRRSFDAWNTQPPGELMPQRCGVCRRHVLRRACYPL
jgi:hypothetical protein